MEELNKPKYTLKFILTAGSWILAVFTTVYNVIDRNQNDYKDFKAEVKSELTEVKSDVKIVRIEFKNGFIGMNNRIRRDSADRKNDRLEYKEELKDLKSMINSISPYRQRAVTNN